MNLWYGFALFSVWFRTGLNPNQNQMDICSHIRRYVHNYIILYAIFYIEIRTELTLAESETYSTVLVQCTVHDHRYTYIRWHIYTYTSWWEQAFCNKSLVYIYQKLLNNYSEMEQEQYIYTYICKLAYIFIYVHTYHMQIHIYMNICILFSRVINFIFLIFI